MSANLTPSERQQLLSLARLSIQRVVCGEDLPRVDLETLPPALCEDGVCFVTLTAYGDLRGCIGGLEATQPLALDVVQHAVAAATEDYRFFPVRPEELAHLHIEISRLTAPVPLEYDNPMDLPSLLHPGVDGVVLRDGFRRSTFLPQVWEKLSDPVMFLNHLCQKMGAPGDIWRRKVLKVEIYHVEEFHEE